MGLFDIFQKKTNYFDRTIAPQCDYCQHGKRTKDGERILCEKKGLVEKNSSCGSFIYSPLKRIPKKQLNIEGALADEEMYREIREDEPEKTEKKPAATPAAPVQEKKPEEAKTTEIPAETPAPETVSEPVQEAPAAENLSANPAVSESDAKIAEAQAAEVPADAVSPVRPAMDLNDILKETFTSVPAAEPAPAPAPSAEQSALDAEIEKALAAARPAADILELKAELSADSKD